jgi:DNA-directed RNA polymerase subunit omega
MWRRSFRFLRNVMARITVEDCLTKENNRFALVQLAAKRTKLLLGGARVLLDEQRGNKAVVTSLREIAAGLVRFRTADEIAAIESKRIAERAAHAAARAATQVFSGGSGSGSGSDSNSDETPAEIAASQETSGSTNGTGV